MWHLKIPKILHVYWGGDKLPYVRYLTLATFRYYNPEWRIILHRPLILQRDITWTTSEQKYAYNFVDYYFAIGSLFIEVNDVDFGELGFSNLASEVHKSDYLRWKLLHEEGGLWADMDIIFTRPMDDLYFNTPENTDINAVFCNNVYGHSIGFLMGGMGNNFFKTIYAEANKEYQKEKYQCIGSLLCNKLFPTVESSKRDGIIPFNIAMDVVYAYDANHVNELFDQVAPNRFTERTIGIHWYAGSKRAGVFLEESDGGFNLKTHSIVDEAIRNFNFLQSKKPFDAIYRDNTWGSEESASGKGSELTSTSIIREQLPMLFKKYNIKRLLDIGCGDFNWMSSVVGELDYYRGVDIVKEVVNRVKEKHTIPSKVEFKHGSAMDCSLQGFDAILLADVLVHNSFNDIKRIINRIASSDVKYIITTHFTDPWNHIDIETGSWRHLNMTREPLNFPEPIESIPYNEPYVFEGTPKNDKTLSLWTKPSRYED